MGHHSADKLSKIGKHLNLTGWFWTSHSTDSNDCSIIEPNAEKHGRHVTYLSNVCTLGGFSTHELIGTLCERSKMTTCEWSVKSK